MTRLVRTCGACPEQYDAFDDDNGGEQVGYLRLRNGYFYVQCPGSGGATVYETSTTGDGCFDEGERDYHLRFAVAAIQRWQKDGDPSRPQAPDVEYEIA